MSATTFVDPRNIGRAIRPWWLGGPKQHRRAEVWIEPFPLPLHPESSDNQLRWNAGLMLYGVLYREPGPLREPLGKYFVEWLPREAYCHRALQLLCETLHLEIMTNFDPMNFSGFGQWQVVVNASEHYGKTLEDACTLALGKLDPLWKRP